MKGTKEFYGKFPQLLTDVEAAPYGEGVSLAFNEEVVVEISSTRIYNETMFDSKYYVQVYLRDEYQNDYVAGYHCFLPPEAQDIENFINTDHVILRLEMLGYL
jgi:hypothetical protein